MLAHPLNLYSGEKTGRRQLLNHRCLPDAHSKAEQRVKQAVAYIAHTALTCIALTQRYQTLSSLTQQSADFHVQARSDCSFSPACQPLHGKCSSADPRGHGQLAVALCQHSAGSRRTLTTCAKLYVRPHHLKRRKISLALRSRRLWHPSLHHPHRSTRRRQAAGSGAGRPGRGGRQAGRCTPVSPDEGTGPCTC